VGVGEIVVLVLVVLVLLVVVRVARRPGRDRPPRPVTTPVSAQLQARVRELTGAGQRIQAVKELREATGLSLLDAKNAVDAIAAGASLPVAPPAESASAGSASGDPRGDLAYRARSLAGAGREADAVRLVADETGMSAPEAEAFVRALRP
jgi:large subunit ribosomal protein L7/L12